MRAAGVPASDIIVNALRVTGARVGFAVFYHRVGDPPGDPSRELVPNLGTGLFDAELRYLASRYRLVPASRLHEAASARRRGERFPLAITFDDDLPSHIRHAAPSLRRHRAPATFFITGASLEAPCAFWWELLQLAVDRGMGEQELLAAVSSRRATSKGSPEEAALHAAARAIRDMDPDARDRVTARLQELAGPPPADAGMPASHVRELLETGFELGFHTRRHDALAGLPESALMNAMVEGREELEAVAGPLTTIAYPHGMADRRVAAAARKAGFRSGFTGVREAVHAESDPLLMGRIEASFASTGQLAVRLARELIRSLGTAFRR